VFWVSFPSVTKIFGLETRAYRRITHIKLRPAISTNSI